jgi:hypothetical protein
VHKEFAVNTTLSTLPPKVLRFPVDKEHYRRIEVEPGVTIFHLYPSLGAWIGREAPDDVNPRSHEDNALTGSVPKAIETTLREFPQDFYLANRGESILAESVSYDPERQVVEVVLTSHSGEDASHGVADGGTTDGVIARVQGTAARDFGTDFRNLTPDQIPNNLRAARVHLEVIVGLEDRDRIGRLVQGRNTSRQVKTWTMADFKGGFDWIKQILERQGGPFRGKVGYEENAEADLNILEVIAIITLFHPSYDDKGKAPTAAYSSKGRMDARLTDQTSAPGYRTLASVLEDILRLHDHVYANFHKKYAEAFPGGKLGRRGKTENRLFPRSAKHLPLTGARSEYQIPTGVLYPLLASLRALIRFPKEGDPNGAKWRMNPIQFFDENGAELMENLISQLEVVQNNPQTLGKTKTVYIALHDRARLLVSDAESAVGQA